MNAREGVKFARTSLIYQCCVKENVKEKKEKVWISFTNSIAQSVNELMT